MDDSNTERGKIFALAMFYLVNHPRMYFRMKEPGRSVWFDAIAYDVGHPLGDRYLMEEVWGSHALVARDYERARIMVRMRDKDVTDPSACKTYPPWTQNIDCFGRTAHSAPR